MNCRCCSFMGVWKCVSGERLVRICDFQWKALKSKMSSRHSPEPYFQLSHTHATLKLVLWLKYFFRSVTLVQCFCADWLETTRETHENINFVLQTVCVSYFCHVFTQRAACQSVFLVEFCNTISVQPRLLSDSLFRRYRAWQRRMKQPYMAHNLNFHCHILVKSRSCFFDRLDA